MRLATLLYRSKKDTEPGSIVFQFPSKIAKFTKYALSSQNIMSLSQMEIQ